MIDLLELYITSQPINQPINHTKYLVYQVPNYQPPEKGCLPIRCPLTARYGENHGRTPLHPARFPGFPVFKDTSKKEHGKRSVHSRSKLDSEH